jgi:hypothetical protein
MGHPVKVVRRMRAHAAEILEAEHAGGLVEVAAVVVLAGSRVPAAADEVLEMLRLGVDPRLVVSRDVLGARECLVAASPAGIPWAGA